MRYNVTNRTSQLRNFMGGNRWLTLAGGEVERGVELSKEEAEALKATNEFHVREVDEQGRRVEAKAATDTQKPAAEARQSEAAAEVKRVK